MRRKKWSVLYEQVQFSKIDDRIVPSHNMATHFFVSRDLLESQTVELMPLTLSRLAMAVVENLGRMSHIRFLRMLYRLNMLSTEPGVIPSIRDIKAFKVLARFLESRADAKFPLRIVMLLFGSQAWIWGATFDPGFHWPVFGLFFIFLAFAMPSDNVRVSP